MNATINTSSTGSQAHTNGPTALPAGTLAPEFALKTTPVQIVKLSEFLGRPVAQIFIRLIGAPSAGIK
jgi:hypothetical protein